MNKNIRIKTTFIVGLFVSLFLAGCKSEKNEPDYKSSLIYLATYPRPTAEQQKCLDAVTQMNSCIAGAGFIAQEMCNPGKLVTSATDQAPYATLFSCTIGVIKSTTCYVKANQASGAVDAKKNLFSSCDVPSGILKTAL